MTRITLALMCLATPALSQTQPMCAPRADMLTALSDKYGETRRSIGMSANSVVVETFASDATGTWSIIFTRPDGVTCFVASGQGFEAVDEVLQPKGERG